MPSNSIKCVCVCLCVFLCVSLYLSTYLGADVRMYRSVVLPTVIRVACGCTESYSTSNPNSSSSSRQSVIDLVLSCRDPGDLQHPVLELLQSVGGAVVSGLMEMGGENAMVASGLEWIKGLAINLPAYELLQVLSLDCILQLFRLMTGSAGEDMYRHVVSRLTPETVSKLWEASGLLASRMAVCASAAAAVHVPGCNDRDQHTLESLPLAVSDVVAIFGQICDHLCKELAEFTTDTQSDSSELLVAIANLRGAARWVLSVSEGDWGDDDLVQIDTFQHGGNGVDLQRQHTINQLLTERQERILATSVAQQRQLYSGVFNSALPFLLSRISVMSLYEADTQLVLLTEVFQLIVDYTECQFVNLPKNGVTTLYEVTLSAMVTFVKRQMTVRPEALERK